MNKQITKKLVKLINEIETLSENNISISYNDYAKELYVNDSLLFNGTPKETLNYLQGFSDCIYILRG